LLKSLEENGYFKNLTKEEKVKKEAEVLAKYSKEVSSQYEKNVWYAGNKSFNKIKDTIF
jgi:hypothetical protein